jgi:hypothetical protein
MYGHQLLNTFERVRALGLIDSRAAFSTRWCGMSEDLLRDYGRREGSVARVNQRVIERLRHRLGEAADLLPDEVASQVREIDAAIVRDLHVADILGRRAVR